MLHKLPPNHSLSPVQRSQIKDDYERLSNQLPETTFEQHILEAYGIDFSTQYGGTPVKSPFGKASGQLSMTSRQVQDDIQAGLGFVVLKTVIAENDSGAQSMSEWAIEEAKMVVEPITGQNGESGWTVSWKGRGWSKSFAEYLDLIRAANELSSSAATENNTQPTLIIPSCKYHLPASPQEPWKSEEYQYTTSQIWNAWKECGSHLPMPLEKDFSPTLAGSSLSKAREQVLNWLHTVPTLIREGFPAKPEQLKVGLKIFNALFDDSFQIELLEAIHEQNSPDFFIYGNRLFDPEREFEGKSGIAYGGPDLSTRNLKVLDLYLQSEKHDISNMLPWSATGNIHSGRMAMEYALRGAENFQMHTFFQLPGSAYQCRVGNKTQKALHELYFNPEEGLIAWMLHLAEQYELPKQPVKFSDLLKKIRSSDQN